MSRQIRVCRLRQHRVPNCGLLGTCVNGQPVEHCGEGAGHRHGLLVSPFYIYDDGCSGRYQADDARYVALTDCRAMIAGDTAGSRKRSNCRDRNRF